jgi:ABC-type branched-subunit amino acid transport system ATPase component
VSALLEIDGLRGGYGDHEILRGLRLRVEEGEIVAIIGPNGAGKSTLLKTIAGLLPPRAGTVVFRGEPIGGAPPEAIIRRGLCYVPQEANVFPGLSVEDNLVIGGWVAKGSSLPRAAEIGALFPILADRRRQRAGSLSGGERQMLAIAMALMVEPVLLLLDEPSAGLAPALQRLIFDRIREINARGVGIVLVEQNARESLRLCRRAYVLVMGQTRAEGPGDELLADPEIRRAYLGGE